MEGKGEGRKIDMITQPTWIIVDIGKKKKKKRNRIIYRRYNMQTKLGTEPFVRSLPCFLVSKSTRYRRIFAKKKKGKGKKNDETLFHFPAVCLNALINGSNKTRFRNRVIKI